MITMGKPIAMTQTAKKILVLDGTAGELKQVRSVSMAKTMIMTVRPTAKIQTARDTANVDALAERKLVECASITRIMITTAKPIVTIATVRKIHELVGDAGELKQVGSASTERTMIRMVKLTAKTLTAREILSLSNGVITDAMIIVWIVWMTELGIK